MLKYDIHDFWIFWHLINSTMQISQKVNNWVNLHKLNSVHSTAFHLALENFFTLHRWNMRLQGNLKKPPSAGVLLNTSIQRPDPSVCIIWCHQPYHSFSVPSSIKKSNSNNLFFHYSRKKVAIIIPMLICMQWNRNIHKLLVAL